MQKVDGSSPIIRFSESPAETAGFFFALGAPRVFRGRDSQEIVRNH